MDAATALSSVVALLIFDPPPVLFRFWDGGALGPSEAFAVVSYYKWSY